MSASHVATPAANLGPQSPIGDFAIKFSLNEALVTKVMTDLGGDLTTPAAVLVAIPQATLDTFTPKIKKPDSEDLLSPIEQGLVVNFLNHNTPQDFATITTCKCAQAHLICIGAL